MYYSEQWVYLSRRMNKHPHGVPFHHLGLYQEAAWSAQREDYPGKTFLAAGTLIPLSLTTASLPVPDSILIHQHKPHGLEQGCPVYGMQWWFLQPVACS